MYQYCIRHGPVLGQYWISTGSVLDQYWINTGSVLDQYWNITGSVLDQYWTSTGPVLDQYWTSTGPVLNQYWTSIGPKPTDSTIWCLVVSSLAVSSRKRRSGKLVTLIREVVIITLGDGIPWLELHGRKRCATQTQQLRRWSTSVRPML